MRQFRGDDTSPWVDRYGQGGAGNLTVSANADYAGSVVGVSGTSGSTNPTCDAAAPANGTLVLIIQFRGTIPTNNYEFNKIASGGGTATPTLSYPLDNTYVNSGADKTQMIELIQYDNVVIDATFTLSAVAWNGSKYGIIPILAKTSIDVNGAISAYKKGFVYGPGSTDSGDAGEGSAGQNVGNSVNANGSGGGGGDGGGASGGSGGAGGGHSNTAANGGQRGSVNPGHGGGTVGNAALTNINPGGAGGSGGGDGSVAGGNGGNGGGIVMLISPSITVDDATGSLTVNGEDGSGGAGGNTGCGGGGAGGSILLKGNVIDIGNARSTATGGAAAVSPGIGGSSGQDGRIHADCGTSFTGTSTPTIDIRYDEYLSDVFANEAIFNRTKYPVAILEDQQEGEFFNMKLNHSPSSIHAVLVSSSLEMPYNIYQYTAVTLAMLYSILRVDARQTYTVQELDPTTWIEPTPTDPSERDE